MPREPAQRGAGDWYVTVSVGGEGVRSLFANLSGRNLERLINGGWTLSELRDVLRGVEPPPAWFPRHWHGDMADESRETLAEPGHLDPRDAHANWQYGVVAGDPEGEHNTGRVAYWYDPERDGAFSDDEMRAAWPELLEGWHALKHTAYLRAQEAGEAEGEFPDLLPFGMSHGGLFGPP